MLTEIIEKKSEFGLKNLLCCKIFSPRPFYSLFKSSFFICTFINANIQKAQTTFIQKDNCHISNGSKYRQREFIRKI